MQKLEEKRREKEVLTRWSTSARSGELQQVIFASTTLTSAIERERRVHKKLAKLGGVLGFEFEDGEGGERS